MQAALWNAQEIILFFDKKGQITFANKSARESLEYEEDFRSCNISDIFPGEIQHNSGKEDIPAIGEVKVTSAYRANRTCFPVKVHCLQLEEKGQDMYCCMAINLSEQILLEKQLAQSNEEAGAADKVKSEFIANITHELRTPVNGILGNTRELVEIEEEPRKKKILSLIERGCADMNAIINNILDFSKLEAGKFTLEKREFRFYDMMDYVVSNHKNRINEKGIDFHISIASDIPEIIIGDELRIVQILNNLLSNAYKFTSVGKIAVEVIKTATTQNKIELFFLVMDSGIGIDKEGMEKLFQSFSQVDASISRKYGGTGLGLNISKQLVELMNGDIHVESEPNKGSVFSFHIWLDLPQDQVVQVSSADMNVKQMDPSQFLNLEMGRLFEYGTDENKDEIQKKVSRLILAVEMDNWEKAESFAESLKQLCANAPKEIKTAALRLKMAVQKGDYDKTIVAHQQFMEVFS